MTNKLQSNNWNRPSGMKYYMEKSNRNHAGSHRHWLIIISTMILMTTMTMCESSDNALRESLNRMKTDVTTMKTTVASLQTEQSVLAQKTAALFDQYRQLYVYYNILDSIADTTGTAAAIIREQQIAIINEMANLTVTMRTLNDLFNQTSMIVDVLANKIDQIELRLALVPRDTVIIERDTVIAPQLVGDGNIFLNQPINDDTINIIIDSVWFRLWRDGSSIEHAGFKSTKKQPVEI